MFAAASAAISAGLVTFAVIAYHLTQDHVVGVAAVPLIAPGTMYDERLYQVDFRASKIVTIGRVRLQANIDLYNVANASSILTLNTTYGSSWLRPTSILQGRLLRIAAVVNW